MPGVRFGRLDRAAPMAGERFVALAWVGPARVEHIISSDRPDPSEQVQGWDEWVLVVVGAAQLEVAGHVHAMDAGDWVLLPAGTPHRVERTEPGTQWIAVHGPAPIA
jgi:cupin 2 domain-containing protein